MGTAQVFVERKALNPISEIGEESMSAVPLACTWRTLRAIRRFPGSPKLTCAPILQRVPRLRSAQDERITARILEVIRVPGCSKRPFDSSLPGGAG